MSEPRSYDALLLDVMGTVCYDPFYEEIPRFFGMTLRELIAVKHPTAWLEFELGEIGEAEFLPRFFADGRAYDTEGLERTFRENFAWLPGMEALLGELHAEGWPIHLFSNYTVWYRWIEERLELGRFADWSCVSCDLGVRKPDPDAYRKAASVAGFPVERCLFVDDRERNCEAARALGMGAIRFENVDRLREELQRIGG